MDTTTSIIETLDKEPTHSEAHGKVAGLAAVSIELTSAGVRDRLQDTGVGKHLLLVEDDRLLSEAVARMLEISGFTVHVCHMGAEALELVRTNRFDLILLDLSLPDIMGHSVLQQVRTMRPELPVIILTGETRLEAKIENFMEGADDYIVKPFHRDELLARIHVVLRRVSAVMPRQVNFGSLLVDLAGHRASVDGYVVPLTGKEYACLEFLIQRRGTTVTKEMFLAHLYGGRDEPEMKIIDVFICKLRRKLLDAGAPRIIETVWGRGYTISGES